MSSSSDDALIEGLADYSQDKIKNLQLLDQSLNKSKVEENIKIQEPVDSQTKKKSKGRNQNTTQQTENTLGLSSIE